MLVADATRLSCDKGTIGVAVSKDATDLLNAVKDGLSIAQSTGKQKAIFQKYTIDPDLQVTAEIKTR